MRVVTYSRYSTDRQTEASIVDQQRRCHEYAAVRDWQIGADFADEGISGAAFGNRPGVQRALAELTAGDVLLVADLSRLSRSQDLAPLLERLRYRDIRVIGVLDGFDSDSPQARMQAGLSGIISDEFRASIRARTHSALQMRAMEKRPTGGRSYGFTSAGDVIEAQAGILREIFARFGAGESMRSIASDLNVRAIPSPGASWKRERRRQDGRWLISALHAILRNERYIGRVVWNRSMWVKDPDSGQRLRRERAESDWIVREGPELIDRKTWERAQARLSERATGRPGGGTRRYLLSGLLVCRECSGHLIVTGARGSHYVCGTHKAGGPAACGVFQSARRAVAEDIILAPAMENVLSPDAVELAVSHIRELERQESAQGLPGENPELRVIVEQIADLEALIADRPSRGASMAPALEALRNRKLALQRAAWRRQGDAVGRSEAVDAYVEAARDMRETLLGKNVEAARAALRSIVGSVPVWPVGRILMAKVGFSIAPLVQAAGLSWNGSGGLLWSQESQILPLIRRAA